MYDSIMINGSIEPQINGELYKKIASGYSLTLKVARPLTKTGEQLYDFIEVQLTKALLFDIMNNIYPDDISFTGILKTYRTPQIVAYVKAIQATAAKGLYNNAEFEGNVASDVQYYRYANGVTTANTLVAITKDSDDTDTLENSYFVPIIGRNSAADTLKNCTKSSRIKVRGFFHTRELDARINQKGEFVPPQKITEIYIKNLSII